MTVIIIRTNEVTKKGRKFVLDSELGGIYGDISWIDLDQGKTTYVHPSYVLFVYNLEV